MKYKFQYGIVILITLFISCKKDFLDVEDTNLLNRQSYVENLKTLNQFLIGIYQKNAELLEDFAPSAYPEIISDNLRPIDVNGGRLAIHYAWGQKANARDLAEVGGRDVGSTSLNGVWMSGYRMTRSCSFVIEEVDKYRKENSSMADNMKGQAYAMRAFIHFKLVNNFAQTYAFTADGSHPGIPYIKTSDISKPYTRLTVAEVYTAMIDDLNNAMTLLEENGNDPRFMNRLAVSALLSRIYLFKGDYENAKRLALEVTGKVGLMTMAEGYPDAVFKFRNLPNTETLFQVVPLTAPLNPLFLGRFLQTFFTPSSDLADLVNEDANDVRAKWIIQSGGTWKGNKFPSGAAPEIMPVISPASAAYYVSVIRSSELFLTISECAAKLGDEVTARNYLNQVRERANPAVQTVTAGGPELLELIYKERRKELCFEGIRMWDLQRWKLGVHRIDAPVAKAKDLPFGSDKAIAPIPPQDVEIMGIPQNKGY